MLRLNVVDDDGEIAVDLDTEGVSLDVSPWSGNWTVDFLAPTGVTARKYARKIAHKLLEAAGDE